MAITAAQLDIIFNSKGADKAKRDIDDVGGSVSRAGSGFDKLKAGALGLGTALIAPMGLGLKSAVQLEQSIANVNAALGGVDSSTLDSLTTSFQDIGTASQYSAIEVANVGEELIKAGFGVEDLLGGMTQSVVDLAQATGDGLGPAMDGVVQIMSTWKTGIVDSSIAMTDASRVADILTVAANESKAGLTDIQAGMRSLAPVAAMMGIPVEDAAAAIALFTNNGLRGADAGVSLARGLQNLADPTSEAATRMDELGIAAFDANGTFVGFPSLFRQLQTSMAGLDDQTKFTALSTIFGAEAMDVMGLAIMNGADPLEAMIALMGESGAAAEQSALRMDTLGAQFETLIEGVTTFLGSLVQGLIPGMRATVDIANDFIDVLMKIPKPIKTIIGAVTAGLAAFAALNMAIKGFAAFNMLTGGAGIGMGGMLGPLLGLAVAAGGLYAAWRTNFLGIRDISEDVFRGVTRFVNDFKAAWDDLGGGAVSGVMDTINQWGGIAEKAGTYTNSFSRALGAVGIAIRGLAGEDAQGWITTIAAGFENAAVVMDSFIQRVRDVQSFDGAVDLAVDVAVSVGSWLIGQIADLGSWLLTTALPAVWDFAVSLPSVAVSIFDWARGAIPDLWSKIKEWAFGTPAGDGTGGATGPNGGNLLQLQEVAVDVLAWARGAIPDVWDWIKTTAIPAMGAAAIEIGSVAVDIRDWAVTAATDLWTAVSNWVTGRGGAGVGDSLMSESGGASTSVGRGPIDLGAVPIKIGDWDITIDFAGLWNEITSRFEASMVMSDDMAASITAAGHTLGLEASNLLMTAIEGAFSGEGGGGAEEFDITGGVGMTISHDWFDDALSLFVEGIISGIQESGIGDKIKAAIKAEFSDLWADMQTTEFWFGTGSINIPLPSINFGGGDGMPGDTPGLPPIGGPRGGQSGQFMQTGRGGVAGGVGAGLGGGASGQNSITVTVEVDTSGAMQAIGDVSAGIAGLSAMTSAVTITADNAMAMQAIGSVSKGLAGLTAMTASVTLTADNAAAMQAIGTVSKGMAGIDSMTSTVILVGDNAAAMQSIGDVSAGMYGIDGMTSTIFVEGDNGGAMGAINEIAAYDGVIIATSYVDIVARQIGSGAAIGNSIIAGTRGALGIHSPSTEFADIAKWTARGFQQGWEREFSNPNIGPTVAALPPVSGYAYSASASAGTGGSGTFAPVINNYIDATGKDIDEEKLTDLAAVKTMAAVQVALERHERAMGGR